MNADGQVKRTGFWGKENRDKRVAEFAGASVWLNAFIAMGKIAMGALSFSVFMCAAGLYNVGIAFSKFLVLKGRDAQLQTHNFMIAGGIIAATTLIYALYGGLMVVMNKGISPDSYGPVIDICIIAVTFIEIVLAAAGIVHSRLRKNLITEGIKYTNLVCALIGLVLTAGIIMTLMNNPNTARYTGIVAVAMGLLTSLIGFQMMWRARKLQLSELGDKLEGL